MITRTPVAAPAALPAPSKLRVAAVGLMFGGPVIAGLLSKAAVLPHPGAAAAATLSLAMLALAVDLSREERKQVRVFRRVLRGRSPAEAHRLGQSVGERARATGEHEVATVARRMGRKAGAHAAFAKGVSDGLTLVC